MKIADADPLAIIILLLGGSPIYEAKKRPVYRKIHPIGISITVCQLSMTLYGFYMESFRKPVIHLFENSIMRISLSNKKAFTVLIPFFYCAAKFVSCQILESYHEKMKLFDSSLKAQPRSCSIDFAFQLKLLKRSRLLANWGFVVAYLLFLPINVGIGILYIKYSTRDELGFWVFYFYQMTVAIFVATALHITLCFYEIHLRLKLLTQMEESLLWQIIGLETENYRIISMFNE